MSTVKANTYQDASGGSNAILYGAASPAGSMGFRNRIINGAMVIDQRNAGASINPSNGQYATDRWKMYVSQTSKLTAQQSSTAPAGFTNSLLITSSSAYSVGSSELFAVAQMIEGVNTYDLGWGSASAKTVTVSFWVRSSLTGTFGGSLVNSAYDRSYPFTYTISSANTWEQKSVTIAGDTSGTWLTNTSAGIRVWFGLGVGSTYSGTAGSWAGTEYESATGATSVVGTNGATWYITGVQLEVGSVATEFERRPYGTELALCQRYYIEYPANSIYYGFQNGTTSLVITVVTPVTLRASPSMTLAAGTSYVLRETTTTTTSSTTLSSIGVYGVNQIQFSLGGFSGLNDLRCANLYTGGKITLSAEL